MQSVVYAETVHRSCRGESPEFAAVEWLANSGGESFTPRTVREISAMILAAERELCHVGETAGIADHDHDLVHELSRRLDALWRYDQYIANAEWRDDLKQFWCDAKAMEQQAIQRIRQLIAQEVRNDCF